ncbi:MAG: DUF599 domain-containing protein [Litoreibacter sp.]|nr:DUF599 domain-containing protein [Litoreibacter sp.]
MTIAGTLSLLSVLDWAALALLVSSWFLLGLRIEHPSKAHPSVSIIMADYRREWMRQLITRQPRIFDATLLNALRQGTSFFASTCIIAIGGLLAVIGNTERLQNVAAEFALAQDALFLWQLKLLVVVLLLTHAFLKFVWSNRLFGYCAVVMAAVPNEVDDPLAVPRALQAAEINIRAALNFNRGLRSIYYGLGALAWLIGPWALLGASALVSYLVWQREFSSLPRKILSENIPGKEV